VRGRGKYYSLHGIPLSQHMGTNVHFLPLSHHCSFVRGFQGAILTSRTTNSLPIEQTNSRVQTCLVLDALDRFGIAFRRILPQQTGQIALATLRRRLARITHVPQSEGSEKIEGVIVTS
jgi:hypothetical protein